MSTIRNISFLVMCLTFAAPTWAGHTLTAQEQKVLESWTSRHPQYRMATDEDCDCPDDIERMRAGSGGVWKPAPDYHPYTATGDFNSDGTEDFAVAVVEQSKQEHNFTLLVFNGPFNTETVSPSFIKSGLELKYKGLFYGPPRPKPYRLLVGQFDSDTGSLLIPSGRSYRLSK